MSRPMRSECPEAVYPIMARGFKKDVGSGANRGESICRFDAEAGCTMKEIADHPGVHDVSVSRAIWKYESEKEK